MSCSRVDALLTRQLEVFSKETGNDETGKTQDEIGKAKNETGKHLSRLN